MECVKEQIKINEDHPLVYIACLSAYNNGFLHGKWVDASEGIDHVRECIKEILSNSPVADECEEWAIHDYQGFGNYQVSEYHELEELCEIAEFLKERKEWPVKVVSSLIDDYGIERARDIMEDDFMGRFDSDLDLAYHLVDELGILSGIPENVARYFDYQAFSRDLEMGDDLFSYSGYYFWNR